MERDVIRRGGAVFQPDISIHTLRMERDIFPPQRLGFLSHFNPHAPHGA